MYVSVSHHIASHTTPFQIFMYTICLILFIRLRLATDERRLAGGIRKRRTARRINPFACFGKRFICFLLPMPMSYLYNAGCLFAGWKSGLPLFDLMLKRINLNTNVDITFASRWSFLFLLALRLLSLVVYFFLFFFFVAKYTYYTYARRWRYFIFFSFSFFCNVEFLFYFLISINSIVMRL